MISLSNRFHKTFNTKTHQAALSHGEQIRAHAIQVEETLTAWLKSDLGAYFQERIEADKATAVRELLTCSPYDTSKVADLQNKINTISNINRYIASVLLQKQVSDISRR